jgi:hypothetical protein
MATVTLECHNYEHSVQFAAAKPTEVETSRSGCFRCGLGSRKFRPSGCLSTTQSSPNYCALQHGNWISAGGRRTCILGFVVDATAFKKRDDWSARVGRHLCIALLVGFLVVVPSSSAIVEFVLVHAGTNSPIVAMTIVDATSLLTSYQRERTFSQASLPNDANQ